MQLLSRLQMNGAQPTLFSSSSQVQVCNYTQPTSVHHSIPAPLLPSLAKPGSSRPSAFHAHATSVISAAAICVPFTHPTVLSSLGTVTTAFNMVPLVPVTQLADRQRLMSILVTITKQRHGQGGEPQLLKYTTSG